MIHIFLGSLVLTCSWTPPLAATTLQDAGEYAWDCPSMGFLPYHNELLVSTDRLARLLKEEGAVVVHVGCDDSGGRAVGRVGYSDGHIPGARFLEWSNLVGPKPAGRFLGSHAEVFRSLGISSDTFVVFYDTGLGMEAATAFVAHEALGLPGRAALLDGQWSVWAFQGLPLSTSGVLTQPGILEPKHSKQTLSLSQWKGLVAEAREGSPSAMLIDARFPLATNIPLGRHPFFPRMSWIEHLGDSNYPVLLGEAELRHRWARIPATEERPLIVGARSWAEAAPVYFIAKVLGYSARILDGSIEDLETLQEIP
jgi:3-mercaptopyruvate sulfurtransferase SseA